MKPQAIVEALQAAIDLVHNARIECCGGPTQPWNFLYHVTQYLKKQRDEVFESVWQEVVR